MEERAPEFRSLEGLEQKYYVHNPETGEYGGFYAWKTIDDVIAYRASDLAASIAAAYRGVAAPEVTVYEIRCAPDHPQRALRHDRIAPGESVQGTRSRKP